jgi:predicted TIM-barrel fold metal-dependent hydrolase
MLAGAFPRTIPAFQKAAQEEASAYTAYYMKPERLPYYIEALGLDNQYDYDPLWQAFMDTRIAVTAHGGSRDWVDRMSWSNDVFNHIDHFANGNHTFAKAVFLGGVVKRFPNLNFAFLEGGMGWGTSLCCDLQGHWEKRNWKAMQENLRPSNVDTEELVRLIEQYGGPRMKERAADIIQSFEWNKYGADPQYLSDREIKGGHYDDFRHLGPIKNKREIRELYARNFYFGCEADDPTTVFAFDPRIKVRLKAMFSSDIGHWDVHHIDEVVPEVYEALEEGHLSEEDFRDFTFSNILQLHGKMNPDFFKGTVVEKEAKAELSRVTGLGAKAA